MTDRSLAHSAAAVSHMDALSVGTRVAEFEILSLLGVGGFGMVYKAFDHSLRRSVAIKEYMPTALAGRVDGKSLWVRSPQDQGTYQAGLSSFVGEARLLAQFDHPSLVKVFRFWEENNTAYMVMPLYSGMTFKQARAQMQAPPSEAWLRKVLWSVCGALRVLHDGKLLHRDISPDNIFLQDCGPPVLLDLGAARHAINDKDRQHTAVLKVNYAPIEQYTDADKVLAQGPWSDLYSLAAVVHGCLCNDTPLPATLRAIRDRLVPFSRVAKTVTKQFGVAYTPHFVAAITRSLSIKPEDRPQSVDEFLAAMQLTVAPKGLEHFDFRAELGAAWGAVAAAGQAVALQTPAAEAEHANDGVHANPHDDPEDRALLAAIDAADTVFLDPAESGLDSRLGRGVAAFRADSEAQLNTEAPAQALPLERDIIPASSRSGAKKPSSHARRKKSRPAWPWFASAAVLICVVFLGARWARGPALAPAQGAAPALAAAVPIAATENAVVAASSEPVPLVDSPSETIVDPVPSPLATPVTAAATVAPARAPVRAVKRPMAEVQPPVASTPAPAPVVVAAPVIEEPRPQPKEVAPPTPQQACAATNLFARPMCIHAECQKPHQAGAAVCVENRRKQAAEELRNRQQTAH